MKRLILLFIFIISLDKHSLAQDKNLTIYAYVNGLVCDFCARALEMTIGKKDEVESINVDLKDKVGKGVSSSEILFDKMGNTIKEEALSALIALGFNKKNAENKINKV